MPSAELPADLVALQAAFQDADAAVAAYVEAVDHARAEEPADGQEPASGRKVWSEEESDELERLRAVRMAALKALWGHPGVMEAMANGSWKDLHIQLKKAVNAPGWV
ncbi:hypothetical protein QMK19_39875 [Streptomyces sp. H10-C2]|uniref:hypothetical protein n=1 Tax=unclassified Streptomyces TaxID=2593676 RepID=UPI0024BBD756|nr:MULTISPECIES: hypothetical protein [unclassified Streptomyces]MDJ0347053.1 hypothetical protein [Streptomyces sp. PH10-H1]MDJ0375583.1 hypothetical protein [Streptomyces sp. H10-C2]